MRGSPLAKPKPAMRIRHGKLQNLVLSSLQNCDVLSTLDLAALAYGSESQFSESQLVSLRRALRTLEAEGRVFRVGRRGDGVREWANERYGIFLAVRTLQRQLSALRDESAAPQLAAKLERYRERARTLGVDVQRSWAEQSQTFSNSSGD
jgi:hypothetical protein